MPHSDRWAGTLVSTAVATAATTAALLVLSSKDTGHPAAALNAVSHMLWGDRAAGKDGPDLRHTAVGFLLNAAAMAVWSAVQHSRPDPRSAVMAGRQAALVTLLAYLTDYHLVPERFTPGFDRRLSKKSLLGSYGVMAASLAVAGWLTSKHRSA